MQILPRRAFRRDNVVDPNQRVDKPLFALMFRVIFGDCDILCNIGICYNKLTTTGGP